MWPLLLPTSLLQWASSLLKTELRCSSRSTPSWPGIQHSCAITPFALSILATSALYLTWWACRVYSCLYWLYRCITFVWLSNSLMRGRRQEHSSLLFTVASWFLECSAMSLYHNLLKCHSVTNANAIIVSIRLTTIPPSAISPSLVITALAYACLSQYSWTRTGSINKFPVRMFLLLSWR